ncbi:MAG: hypothetical protein IJT66_02570, partial [Clostridia bacterium]|nr:hypothetical protein [Clostridia bacterium]
MNKTAYSKHRLALEALFLMGEAVLFLPGNESGKYYFFGFLVAITVAIIGIALIIPIINHLFADPVTDKGIYRWLRAPIGAAAALGGFACAGLCFKRFVGFVSAVFLTSVNKFWIVLILKMKE